MEQRYPPIEPHAGGYLDIGDGRAMYWEACGNVDGVPALFLHGGPGSEASAGQRQLFDPSRFRAVLFDQRGSGRSRPRAEEPEEDLATNTTPHLIADIELLREHLGVDQWVLLGLSWGTTLGLAYAQAYPARVAGAVFGLVTTTSRREVEWITHGVGRLFPEAWDRFARVAPESLRHLSLADAYATMLADRDPAVRDLAAREWCRWEDTHISLTPNHRTDPRYADPAFRLRFARLVTHYWRHAAFLEEDQLLRDAARLNGIPGVLIHGRYDVSSPLETPWRLSERWEDARLVILDDAGHGGGATLLQAIDDGLHEVADLAC